MPWGKIKFNWDDLDTDEFKADLEKTIDNLGKEQRERMLYGDWEKGGIVGNNITELCTVKILKEVDCE